VDCIIRAQYKVQLLALVNTGFMMGRNALGN
jgi:hypothetical protein